MTSAIPLRRRLFYVYSSLRYWFDGLLFRLGLYRGPATPHVIKRKVIQEYASRYGTRCFVETGTYMGDMTAAMLRRFERLFSIELSIPFHQKAVARFARHPHVRILQGDSATEIKRVLPECDARTLFWLDAHWSGGSTARGDIDTPVSAEVETIFGRDGLTPVILIDDARCFTGTDGYPTIDELRANVSRLRPGYDVAVEQDIIRIVPKQEGS